ncbi:MAG: holo-ACP synthase [Bacilli bacterium]|nr:holo-ACP synthase [Bacilli bacterium]
MSKEIGIDIVEFAEIKEKVSDKFIQRILSIPELERYHAIHNEKRKLEYLAGRFAAKEAYTKVYKTFDQALNFTDVQVLSDQVGAPYIVSKYRPEDTIKISISHSKNYVIAICIKE